MVDFWAPWCGPCRAVSPILDDIAHDVGGQLRVVKLDIDENPTTAKQYDVLSIPTMILFKGGQPVARMIGARPKAAIVDEVVPHLAAAD